MNGKTSHARDAIERAFLELALKRPFPSITATDIIVASGYSRASFYRHYRDKYDLVEQVFMDEVHGYVGDIVSWMAEGFDTASDFEYSFQVMLRFFRRVHDRRDLYLLVMNSHIQGYGFEDFCVRAIAEFRACGTFVFLDDGSPMDESFFFDAITRLSLGFVRYWVERDFSDSPERMAEQTAAFCSAGGSVTSRERLRLER